MRPLKLALLTGCSLLFAFAFSASATVHVRYAEPTPGSMPEFTTVPFPNNLYFDGGAFGAGDGTLINQDPSNPDGFERFGLEVHLVPQQDRVLMGSLDRMDGFGVTSPTWFFFDGPIQESSLPGEPVVDNGRVQRTPTAADSVLLVEVGSNPPQLIPVKFRFGFETRIPNLLAIVPLEGEVLKPNTEYVAVVTTALLSEELEPVRATAAFEASKSGDNHSAAVAYLGAELGIAENDIVGLAPFRTQTTTATLRDIRNHVVDACPTTVDFGDGWVFDDSTELDSLFGAGAAPALALAASGFIHSPRLQDLDGGARSHRDGSGGAAETDFPVATVAEIADEQFNDRGSNGGGCDLTTGTTPDGLPDVVDVIPGTPELDLALVPVSLSVPAGTPPAGGWPVVIVQHGLGGSRTTTLLFSNRAAEEGFAVVGIDAVDHGLRWDETDDIFNFTGEPGQDGLPDGDLGGAVQLGFFEAFANLGAIRDNFRQTYVDLMQLVRILSADGFDTPLGVDLDPDNIYYLGLSLGGLMGAGMTPYVPEVRGIVLDAPGGGLTSELFGNSVIGSGSLPLIQGLFGLDPENPSGDFALFTGISQSILDPGDGTVSAVHWVNDPFPAPFKPMNVILIESMNDEVVPNQSNESLAVAAGLQLFDPHVVNLPATTRPLVVASTQGFLEHNEAGNVTAGVFQVGPSSHAQITEGVSRLSLVPGTAHVDEFRNADLSTVFVPLIRPVRVKHPDLLGDIYDWYRDMVSNPGEGGRFAYSGPPLNFNSYENQIVGKSAATYEFFNRNVNAGGLVPYEDATPNGSIAIKANRTVGRLSMVRSTLGATPDGNNGDMPPNIQLGTPGVLPFFLGIQRPAAPAYRGEGLSIDYTDAELAASGCNEDALFIGRHNAFTSHYQALPSEPDPGANRVRLGTGHFQGGDGVYGLFCSTDAADFDAPLKGRSLRMVFPRNPDRPESVKVNAQIFDPSETLEIDPTAVDIHVRIWEDRDHLLFERTLDAACWSQQSSTKWMWNCEPPVSAFSRAFLRKVINSQGLFYKFGLTASGEFGLEEAHEGGGGSQIQIEINGSQWSSSGGRCSASRTRIACSRFD